MPRQPCALGKRGGLEFVPTHLASGVSPLGNTFRGVIAERT
jgi:hypothetical protein